MVLLVSLKDVILQPFSCVVSCFVGIWSILECISWCCSLFLATSSFFWSVPSFVVVLDVLYPLDHGFLKGFSPWSFGYLACRFFHLYKQFHFSSMIVYLSFPVLYILSVLLFYFIVFLSIWWFLLPLSFLILFLLLLLFPFLSIFLLWAFIFLYYHLWCQCDLFLIEHLPLYLFFQEYVIVQNHNLVISNTIELVIYWICVAS